MQDKSMRDTRRKAEDALVEKYLSFRLGDDNFGTEILKVREIMEYGEVTEVPMMPEFIRGAINLRGHVVPVVDLALRIGKQEREVSRRTCIVIVEVKANGTSLDVGLIVDAVNSVVDISRGDIESAPSFGGRLRTEFIRGMGKVNDKFIILLDVDRMLSLDDLGLLGSVSDMPASEVTTEESGAITNEVFGKATA